jgi:Putative zinc-finger
VTECGETGHVAPFLPGYAAGTLGAAERRRVQAHVLSCPACQAELTAWRAIGAAARDAYGDASPEDDTPLRGAWDRIAAGTAHAGSGRREAERTPEDRHVVPAHSRPVPPRLARWAGAQFATAALVVLVLGLGYVAFVRSRPGASPPGSPAPAGVASETLQTLTLPAEALPLRGRHRRWALITGWRVTYAPGASAQVPAAAAEQGAAVEIVLEGAYAVRAEAAIRVVRADGAVDDVPPGTEVRLGPGDAVLYLDDTAAQAYRNPGDRRTVVLGLAVVVARDADRADALAGAAGVAVESLGTIAAADVELSGIVAGPLVVALRRVTVAPGAHLPAADGATPTLRYVEAGAVAWGPDGSAATVVSKGQAVPWTPSGSGGGPVLRNDGPAPAVVLEFAIAAAPPGPGTPAP